MATGLRKKITYEEAINNINPDGSIKGNKKIAYVERSASKFIKSYEYNKLLNADPVDLDNVTLDSRKREEMIKELNEREESTAEQIEESHQKWEARKQEKKRNTIQRMQEKQPKPTPIEAMASADEPEPTPIKAPEIKPKPKAKSTPMEAGYEPEPTPIKKPEVKPKAKAKPEVKPKAKSKPMEEPEVKSKPMEDPEVQVEPKGKRGRPRKSAEASSSSSKGPIHFDISDEAQPTETPEVTSQKADVIPSKMGIKKLQNAFTGAKNQLSDEDFLDYVKLNESYEEAKKDGNEVMKKAILGNLQKLFKRTLYKKK